MDSSALQLVIFFMSVRGSLSSRNQVCVSRNFRRDDPGGANVVCCPSASRAFCEVSLGARRKQRQGGRSVPYRNRCVVTSDRILICKYMFYCRYIMNIKNHLVRRIT